MTFDASKYLPEKAAHPDMFNVQVDGQAEGPGPAHYSTLQDVFVGASDWIWLYAEATRRNGGKGLTREWDTTIFRSGSKYGFTTPRQQSYSHASGHRNLRFFRQRLALESATPVGYLHSHPRGGAADFEFAGSANVLSRIDEDPATGQMTGDLAYAVMFPNLWVGLLNPKGGVYRVKLRPAVVHEFARRGLTTGTGMLYDDVRPVLAKYRKQGLFETRTDRGDRGRGWAPGSSAWREKRIGLIESEVR